MQRLKDADKKSMMRRTMSMKGWERWKVGGLDEHSRIGDPRFVDLERGDFRLKPDSPAFKLGFKPIPVDQIGPFKSKKKVESEVREGSVVFYVSASGKDAWSGKKLLPDKNKTDGPFATLQRARDAIRKLKQKQGGRLQQPVIVSIRGGMYFLSEPLVLTAEDSGSKEAPVIYQAFRKEKVFFVGGKSVTGFKPVNNPEILERLTPVAKAHVLCADLRAQGIKDFGEMRRRGFGQPIHEAGLELFFKDQPMQLARWPNEGFLTIANVPEQGEEGGQFSHKGGGQFKCKGEKPKLWSEEEDIWVHGYWWHDWADSYEKVDRIDKKLNIVCTCPPHGVYGYKQGQRFYFLNILEELDEPGEWYLDRKTGFLYFWPPEPIKEGEAAVSLLSTFIMMKDTSYISFKGLTFEVCRGTAVKIEGGSHNCIADCTLRNIGNIAVVISGGTANGVEGCEIYQAGDGGIHIDGGERKTLTPGGHYADNNHIYNYNRWCRTGRLAVQIDGVGNRISHNLIHDGPHIAIWLTGNDHIIEFNEIHSVCSETDDCGAFYAGRDWTIRGNIIRYNFFHHIAGMGNISSWAIYLDDCVSGFTVFGNIFYKTGGLGINSGRDHIIENNIFASCRRAVEITAFGVGCMKDPNNQLLPRLQAVPYQDPPWSTKYPQLVNILEDEPGAPKGIVIRHNIFWRSLCLVIGGVARKYITTDNNLIDKDSRYLEAPWYYEYINTQQYLTKDPRQNEENTFKEILKDYTVVYDFPKVWKFIPDPADIGIKNQYFLPETSEQGWEEIRIRCWWQHEGYDYDGLAWYRIWFEVPETLKGQQIFVVFGAVDNSAWVYVNGKLMGDNGLTLECWDKLFMIDITSVVDFSQKNLLAVRVDDTEWMGGIWKSVKLVVKRTPA